jgi:DMSO/TMAO reductase YedYZ molybdopterin-dependent catalytic subunit
MKKFLTRRQAIAGGLASIGGVALTGCSRDLPPTYGSLLRMADNLTYVAHRTLLPQQALVKEYSPGDVTPFPAIGTTNHHVNVADWRLSVEGLVKRPQTFTLAQLKALSSRTQITRHTCEEGWSAIAQWTGVPLSVVLDAAGMLPNARYVKSHSADDFENSIDLLDALHPQTILAYAMNGHDLSVPHGAPLRLRVERQLGYKGLKYLTRLIVTREFDDGDTKGDLANGWSWYTGI